MPLQTKLLIDCIVILRFLLSTKFGFILCRSDENGRNIYYKTQLFIIIRKLKKLKKGFEFSINVNRRYRWEIR